MSISYISLVELCDTDILVQIAVSSYSQVFIPIFLADYDPVNRYKIMYFFYGYFIRRSVIAKRKCFWRIQCYDRVVKERSRL